MAFVQCLITATRTEDFTEMPIANLLPEIREGRQICVRKASNGQKRGGQNEEEKKCHGAGYVEGRSRGRTRKQAGSESEEIQR